jgi:hypothetical protein
MKKPFGVDAVLVLRLCICIVSHSIGQLITDTEIRRQESSKSNIYYFKSWIFSLRADVAFKKRIFLHLSIFHFSIIKNVRLDPVSQNRPVVNTVLYLIEVGFAQDSDDFLAPMFGLNSIRTNMPYLSLQKTWQGCLI